MKILLVLAAIILLAPVDSRANSPEVRTVHSAGITRRVTVVGRTADPKRVIVVYPGYRPKGDPYSQFPSIFVQNWGLVKFAQDRPVIILIPDFGTSLHRFTAKDGRDSPEKKWLKEFLSDISGRYGAAEIVLVGVSTGVEGMIKSLELLPRVKKMVAISGTYRYSILPRDSGEYRIHEKEFGTNSAVWDREEPATYLGRLNRPVRIHLFCESDSIFRSQADWLKAQEYQRIDLRDELSFGVGRGHSWKFWGDRAFVNRLQEILAGRSEASR